MNKNLLALGAAALTLAFSSATQAATTYYDLTLDGCTGTCGGGSYGTIAATPNGSSWDILVSLAAGNTFHSTNDPQHHALVFDLVGNPSIIISGLGAPFTLNGTQAAGSTSSAPFGAFDYVINFPKQRHPPALSSFGFNIAPVNPANVLGFDFNANAGGNVYFATDITGTNGNTGNVGGTLRPLPPPVITQTAPPPGVPEPATWAMTILGFGAIGCSLRRRAKAVLA
jgi:hypothetical protein